MIDFSSHSWREVSSWAEARLQSEREKNDATSLDPTETAALRGRIAILKELLALPRVETARAQMGRPDQ